MKNNNPEHKELEMQLHQQRIYDYYESYKPIQSPNRTDVQKRIRYFLMLNERPEIGLPNLKHIH